MSGAPTPPVLLEPIASDAGGSYITNPIPNTPTGTSAASIEGGFPPITMESELTGGEPPLGQDMNGFLYLVSSHTMYVQCGQPYLFNTEVVDAIGGYAIGTILGMADGTGIWINLEAGNTNNPDVITDSHWAPVYSNGTATVAMVNGTNTLVPSQYAKSIIFLTGALTANSTVEFPETFTGQWLIVNQTTGGFTVTAFAAGGGLTLAIPAGGASSPTGIASDGTNIFPNSTPLSVPIDQAATPLTLVERTNLGYIYATYFNQSSGFENPTIGGVFVQNSAADGFLRKIALTSFEAQMNLAGIAGAVVPAQVPFSAVSQWATALFALSSFTAAVATRLGNNTNGGFNLGIFQIRFIFATSSTAAPTTVNWQTPFTTACVALVAVASGGVNGTINASAPSASQNSVTFTNGAAGQATSIIAIGY